MPTIAPLAAVGHRDHGPAPSRLGRDDGGDAATEPEHLVLPGLDFGCGDVARLLAHTLGVRRNDLAMVLRTARLLRAHVEMRVRVADLGGEHEPSIDRRDRCAPSAKVPNPRAAQEGASS